MKQMELFTMHEVAMVVAELEGDMSIEKGSLLGLAPSSSNWERPMRKPEWPRASKNTS